MTTYRFVSNFLFNLFDCSYLFNHMLDSFVVFAFPLI